MFEPRGFRFDVAEVLTELLEERLDLDGALEEGIDSRRVTGKTNKGEHVSILIKPVGPNNAATFKRWVTLSPSEAEGLREGPRGWHGYVAMIGLLDDGNPWWVGVYDRDDLRAAMYGAEQINNRGGTGHFYRWDPGLLKPIIFKDLLEPEPEPVDTDAELRVVLEDVKAGRWTVDEGIALARDILAVEAVK